MIAVDTSVLMAILLEEKDAAPFAEAIATRSDLVIGAPTAFELYLAAYRKLGLAGLDEAQLILPAAGIRVIDWQAAWLPLAKQALVTFGKGRHPAKLNFGDCMVYAVAKALDVPLLYKGNDFSQTDIRSAL